jgi:ABC-type branched-subunit amino acid transport system substrate-binding protein
MKRQEVCTRASGGTDRPVRYRHRPAAEEAIFVTVEGSAMNRRIILTISKAAIVGGTLAVLAGSAAAQSGQPIKIGFSMAMTGGLAANGKSALLAQKIWEEDVNVKGGLLGRPVKLVYYDDQSNPSTVPGIYTKLLDVDKVDLISAIGGCAEPRAATAVRGNEAK